MTRNLTLLLLLMLVSELALSQALYHKWFGPKDAAQTLVFLHGGPGYNSASFEFDMAPRLAKRGYQVLVYDQRGCGRSEAMTGDYTYAEAVEDLRGLLSAQGVQKAFLLGHSFGGTIAVEFAHAHTEMVAGIVLISAPMDFPACFRSIQTNCRIKMEERDDSVGLKSIAAVALMDSTNLQYSGSNFMYAMANGLYTPSESFKEATKIKKKLAKSPLAKWTKKSSFPPVTGFYEKEHYTLNDHTTMLSELVGKLPVAGIFGDEDGLFTPASLEKLENVIGGDHFYVLSLASHAVFLDDPYGFLDALGEYLSQN
jgi:proline iminopeptidase